MLTVGRRSLVVGEKCKGSWLTEEGPDQLFSFAKITFKYPVLTICCILEKKISARNLCQ